ncbi:conjugative transposon protein TraJ [Mucilaginibacter ginsenosidivorans]|uniref:Conjugative transposon protein TraJ n=1 Tax=Mucilaginibacter ginsenosidivorans TaxID=398053 RepID=A0A5B8UUA6_9SPHI|nr:conjugative transposon protein TraJ [Mucilaginibacter ginsenosidivorans]QEC62468.1 conjugative transposon protein TraJ [Mucilaginibacter ginsenosidivorans]
MKRKIAFTLLLAGGLFLLPSFARADGIADDLRGLQGVLSELYDQMMPLCSGMIGVSRAIAGFAALWYIGARIWKHIAAAEPVDVYPLLRPFALGICIAAFPAVLSLMNGVLQPVVTATQGMVQNNYAAIAYLTQQPDENNEIPAGQQNADPDKWYQYSHPDGTTADNGSSNPIADAFSGWSLKNMVRKWIAELLNILFQAAALCLDTIRTFKLIVLAILGPLCFGLSVFDGFHHTLKQWVARYVNVFMWLPIANIFGAIIAKIQVNMITLANSGQLGGNSFGNTSTAYLIFLLIGILGYFTVPSIANYIMNVGGHALFNKTSALASMAVSYVSGTMLQNVFGGSTRNQPQTNHYKNKPSGNTYNTEKLQGSPGKKS